MFCTATARAGNFPSGVPKGRHLPRQREARKQAELPKRGSTEHLTCTRGARQGQAVVKRFLAHARNDRRIRPLAGWGSLADLEGRERIKGRKPREGERGKRIKPLAGVGVWKRAEP